MTVSIVIQHREDHPGNPGWWRFSRPRHQVRAEAPRIREETRWWYGSEEDAAAATAEWDAKYPQG
jgi:hypothetical protein